MSLNWFFASFEKRIIFLRQTFQIAQWMNKILDCTEKN